MNPDAEHVDRLRTYTEGDFRSMEEREADAMKERLKELRAKARRELLTRQQRIEQRTLFRVLQRRQRPR